MRNTPKGLAAFWIIIIIFLILILGFGIWFVWNFVLSGGESEGTTTPSTATTATTTGSQIDSALVGTWESDCLVPVADNKWAEQHKIVINKDATATHTRLDWAMNDCTTLQPNGTITTQYKLAIPSAGKINLTVTGYENTRMTAAQAKQMLGGVVYDIYQVTGSTLEFGHGFRVNYPTSTKTGGSEADRFDTLNDYIVYQKK